MRRLVWYESAFVWRLRMREEYSWSAEASILRWDSMRVTEGGVKIIGRFTERIVAMSLKQSWMSLSFCAMSGIGASEKEWVTYHWQCMIKAEQDFEQCACNSGTGVPENLNREERILNDFVDPFQCLVAELFHIEIKNPNRQRFDTKWLSISIIVRLLS